MQTELDRLIIKIIAKYDDELYEQGLDYKENKYYNRKNSKQEKNSKTDKIKNQNEFNKYYSKFCKTTTL